MDRKLGALIEQMMDWDRGSHERIAHNLRVLGYAAAIAKGEGAEDELEEIVEAAAVVHDAGIRPALEKHGSSAGPYQEQEGAEPAGRMLRTAGYPDNVVQRVQELVAHHHTYRPVLGMDHQILLEADLLVNMDDDDPGARQGAVPTVIKTPTGLKMYDILFGAS